MIRTDHDDTYGYVEPCRPCVSMYGEEGARAELVRNPSPEQLAEEGQATLGRIQAIAAEPAR